MPTLMSATDAATGAVTVSSDQPSPFSINGSSIDGVIIAPSTDCLGAILSLLEAHVNAGGSTEDVAFEADGAVSVSDGACGDGQKLQVRHKN